MSDITLAVEELRQCGGYWTETLDPLIELAPQFVEAYIDFSKHPFSSKNLSPKLKCFVSLAVHAAATHLHEPGIRLSIRNALRAGATKDELIEVLQLTTTLGVHACVYGIPVLVNELGGVQSTDDNDLERARLKASFIEKRGYWDDHLWEGLLTLDPGYFRAFTAFSSSPWETSHLEPKEKELVYIAFDVSATHMFSPGTALHIRNAMKYGATAGEIVEVMQIASTIGIQTFELALPILMDELELAETEKEKGSNDDAGD